MRILNLPTLVLVVCFISLFAAEQIGVIIRRKAPPLQADDRQDFDLVLTATLTLLGLIIGFSFSMAVSRYDQRNNCEEAEANAIGTEFVRADLLPPAEAGKVRTLLRQYLDQRITFYTTRDGQELQQASTEKSRLQSELWDAVLGPSQTNPNPAVALAVSGMNDVLNSEGYTQAAWWNRLPRMSWVLLVGIAVVSNFLFGLRTGSRRSFLVVTLPLVLSICFFLIADIDSPRGGVIRVRPQNLTSLSLSLKSQ